MANLSDLSRKEQILRFLLKNKNEWVDGTRLTTAEVGGSEGLRRLRELRSDGYLIEQRRHPDPGRDIWQYRLIEKAEVSPLRPGIVVQQSFPTPSKPVFGVNQFCSYCKATGKQHGLKCAVCNGRGWL